MAARVIPLPGVDLGPETLDHSVSGPHPAFQGMSREDLKTRLRHAVTMADDSELIALTWMFAGLEQARDRAARGR